MGNLTRQSESNIEKISRLSHLEDATFRVFSGVVGT